MRGCAAVCRVRKTIPNLVAEDHGRVSVWSAAAKPFGVLEDDEGDKSAVTAYKGFVTPVFADVRLVPIDTVGGKDLATADAVWMRHVRRHLPEYILNGPNVFHDCYYCVQLLQWEKPTFRRRGAIWLKYHGMECRRPTGPGSGHGGTPHGH